MFTLRLLTAAFCSSGVFMVRKNVRRFLQMWVLISDRVCSHTEGILADLRGVRVRDVKNHFHAIYWTVNGLTPIRGQLSKIGESSIVHEKQKRAEAKTKEEQKRAEAKRKKRDEALKHSLNLFQTFVIVGALVATITFAAAFTIPGGYDGNQGRDQEKEDEDRYLIRYSGAMFLIILSMFSLMIAFIAATFAVLAHAIALAVSTCIIACFPIIGYFVELGKYIARR
ncbi:hypothetical protein RHSIM_Rhsim04G0192100 [Rhododendron simsii]|uniref:PGG domain-containing protein n=1 Tax=Rhododendron simsii TaxID=118357 RepID=A0A834H147_RHOSS|nr:hypothetical protein RHSIM_Rhsim04G0192100 [Rhododendron simsii]